MNVTVIGGGIIGLCSAYSLAKAGHEVTVIDSQVCGQGASRGNAGWIVPALSAPFNSPGAIEDAIKSMFHPHGATRFQTFPHWDFLKWAALFYRNSSRSESATARRALLGLNAQTFDLFGSLRAEIKMEVHDDGLLLPFRTDSEIENFLVSFEKGREAGNMGKISVLGSEKLQDLEPALDPRLAGGIHLTDEKSVRPETFTAGLSAWLHNAGVKIIEHRLVHRLEQRPGGWSLETDSGRMETQQVVVAAGSETARLLRTAGVKLLMEPGRGCSVTISGGPSLRQPIKLNEARVACTPFEGGTRYVGTFDFAGHKRPASLRRMQSVIHEASDFIPALKELTIKKADVWSGVRTSTPDSVPYIGAVPGRNGLVVATGHGTLGLTLAPVTGDAVAMIVGNEPLPVHIRACAVDRPQVRF
ncbi:NAD(P)/FAD-dependent oxidoreductase [Paeniglutamicibacter psychrophenolicus]|uniref:NAD(P)/FAD-dependent oxidoreductase n=1 Tax=Paeniglutamicibacter psychrophenolicus TaxID=257454 RepID=UPI002783DD26|nr:FAD-dependent oxidoreductase [Paeniglutamicibacter psychrophenolicus]MDQ0093055.1 D-amino-acid dehydrogenase [Paeniglutamicibacter psychrophenolicus]